MNPVGVTSLMKAQVSLMEYAAGGEDSATVLTVSIISGSRHALVGIRHSGAPGPRQTFSPHWQRCESADPRKGAR